MKSDKFFKYLEKTLLVIGIALFFTLVIGRKMIYG